jgi:hypothetical protein
MIKKIVTIIAFIVGVFYLRQWFLCVNFADPIHFSAFDMSLKLQDAIHNDIGFGTNTVRIFHNKLALGAILISNSYLHFWDVRFASLLFSPVLYFGIWCGFWYLTQSKTKHKWFILAFLLLLPFVEIFKIGLHYFLRLGIITLPLIILSLFGLRKFIEKDSMKRTLLITILIIFSVWYLSVFGSDIFLNCFKG